MVHVVGTLIGELHTVFHHGLFLRVELILNRRYVSEVLNAIYVASPALAAKCNGVQSGT